MPSEDATLLISAQERASAKLAQLEGKFTRTARNMERLGKVINRAWSWTYARLGRVASRIWQIGKYAALAGAAFAGWRVVEGFKLNAKFEAWTISFETFLKSATLARDRLDWLYKFSARTPFFLPELTDAARLLEAYGLNATKWLRTIGNVAIATSTPLQQVVESFARLQTGQTGEAMRMMRRSGVPVNTIKGLKFSKMGQIENPTAEAMQIIKGWIETNWGDLIERQSRTLIGRSSTIRDIFNIFMKGATAQPFKRLSAAAGELVEKLWELDKNGTLAYWEEKIGSALDTGLVKMRAFGGGVLETAGYLRDFVTASGGIRPAMDKLLGFNTRVAAAAFRLQSPAVHLWRMMSGGALKGAQSDATTVGRFITAKAQDALYSSVASAYKRTPRLARSVYGVDPGDTDKIDREADRAQDRLGQLRILGRKAREFAQKEFLSRRAAGLGLFDETAGRGVGIRKMQGLAGTGLQDAQIAAQEKLLAFRSSGFDESERKAAMQEQLLSVNERILRTSFISTDNEEKLSAKYSERLTLLQQQLDIKLQILGVEREQAQAIKEENQATAKSLFFMSARERKDYQRGIEFARTATEGDIAGAGVGMRRRLGGNAAAQQILQERGLFEQWARSAGFGGLMKTAPEGVGARAEQAQTEAAAAMKSAAEQLGNLLDGLAEKVGKELRDGMVAMAQEFNIKVDTAIQQNLTFSDEDLIKKMREAWEAAWNQHREEITQALAAARQRTEMKAANANKMRAAG
ncbi:MAG TPA: hypothetical protein VM487_18585 [Phycisphaerae bacterium]|nr:hypothetical protein [Phycisphaerae bacterium]